MRTQESTEEPRSVETQGHLRSVNQSLGKSLGKSHTKNVTVISIISAENYSSQSITEKLLY